jgi:uncharacterized protein (DUF2141 family)
VFQPGDTGAIWLIGEDESVPQTARGAPERKSIMADPALAGRRAAGAALSAAGVLALLAPAAPAGGAVVEVAVTGVAQARGHVRVELCTQHTFLTEDCPYQGAAAAKVGATVVRIAEVPPGVYAAQAFHDETDQGVVHQNLLGIPRERVGFSNDAPVRVRGPRFKDAAFLVGDEVQRITFRLRRLFGGKL